MPGRPPRERPLRPVPYSPAARGKLPSPSGEGCSENLSVHPSTKAGQLHTYPNKVFDYMASGRPVVLAIDGVIRRVVEEAGAGMFVPPGDANAMAGAVLRYARDPALRERHGRAGRPHVETHFRREAQGEALRELLREVVGEG